MNPVLVLSCLTHLAKLQVLRITNLLGYLFLVSIANAAFPGSSARSFEQLRAIAVPCSWTSNTSVVSLRSDGAREGS